MDQRATILERVQKGQETSGVASSRDLADLEEWDEERKLRCLFREFAEVPQEIVES